MPDPLATIVRFDGDSDDLLHRFEEARGSWVDAHDDHVPPVFYAACKTEIGIAIVLGWETDADHSAFRKQITTHLKSAGLRRPATVERLTIAKLGWTEAKRDRDVTTRQPGRRRPATAPNDQPAP